MLLCGDIAREPCLVDKDENIAKAFDLLMKKKETHVVVTDEGKVVGILSVKDLLRTVLDRMRWGSSRVGKLYVSAVMTPQPIYVKPDTDIFTAAKLMVERGISSLVVAESLENFEDVLILTKRDFLQNWPAIYESGESVSRMMTRNPITIRPGSSISHAEWLLRERNISTLPVVEEGMLVGYLDARVLSMFIVKAYLKGDIKHFDRYLEEVTVSDAMRAPHYILEDQTLLEAAEVILRRRAKGTPVLSGDKLTGIITETDFAKIIAGRR